MYIYIIKKYIIWKKNMWGMGKKKKKKHVGNRKKMKNKCKENNSNFSILKY